MSSSQTLARRDDRLRHRRPAGERTVLLVAGLLALLVALPIVALFVIAFGGVSQNWSHLLSTVLPSSALVTAELMAGVALVTAVFGTVPAWLVTSFRFPGRRVLAVALVVPLAVPTYIAAYCFNEYLHYVGPVQSAIRSLFGFTSRRDYWFPEIRSLWGAVLILSSVLYPYVFLTVRVMFAMQGRRVADVARTLGAGPLRVFLTVLLPMARPAIAVGVALALMESVNDIGAVEFLGVQTLTFTVYATWLNRGDLVGATQIALAMLAVIVGLVLLERHARRRQRFTVARGDGAKAGLEPLTGWRAGLAILACATPILLGFGIPAYVLADYASRRLADLSDPALWRAAWHSLAIAGTAAVLTVAIAFAMAYGARLTKSRRLEALSRIGSAGYAIPGTVLAMGILVPFAAFDNQLDALMRSAFGVSTGLLLSGSGAAIVFACIVRFMAMGHGSVESGFAKVSPHLDMASRTLGRGPAATLREVLLPLMRPALLTSLLLVFVDCVKELSATVLLRPFDFDTLATHVYAQASRAAFQDGAVAALLIVAIGMAPVLVLTRSIAGETERG
ncbi:iron ABC transporter permease [Aurantimonas sp. Leaf443]|uniref:ABC transporter permease n=1 Tax=Aurantimonas sp. Leaf443 TaxID=1736378 RepID=UPI0006FAB529|nr:iron ABC transporter permease [Aurantimonas sp. Leaf443]KQT87937.1 iron ABC transporter permease [Aurantimonas sp. Leaf443]